MKRHFLDFIHGPIRPLTRAFEKALKTKGRVGNLAFGGMFIFLLLFFTQDFVQAQNHWEPFYNSYFNSQKEEDPKKSILVLLQKYRQETFHPFMIDESLSGEFRDRHYQTFNRDTYHRDNLLLTPAGDRADLYRNEEETDRYKKFSSYMLRRLGEYHVQQVLEKREDMKKVVEIKEKLTNTDFSISDQFMFKAHYSIAGDFLDFQMQTPWFTSRILLEKMVSGLEKPIFFLDRQLNSKWTLKTSCYVDCSYLSILGLYKINESMEMSMGGASYLADISNSELTRDKPTLSTNKSHLIYHLTWFY